MRTLTVFFVAACLLSAAELSIEGTRFRLDGKPFPYTGVTFFNAVYNPEFNKSSEDRKRWLAKFQKYGINVIRVWAQWDNKRGFVNSCPECSLYFPDGRLREDRVKTLSEIVRDAGSVGMVVELAMFSQESWHDGIKLDAAASDRAVAALTKAMAPHRNLILQVWNEFSERVLDHVKTIRGNDARRIVTNSAGGAGFLGDPPQNRALDFLSPHTSRQGVGRTWEIAPKELAYLLKTYGKPVVDDEPARNGTSSFGGPKQPTDPMDHILQIAAVWQLGAYVVYHHDMFQTGAGTAAVPPSGIPDPEFSPYHRQVFEFLAKRARYMPLE
ncbi:MAG: hypothetical protein SGI92_27745 [Bryobacteraceae bacterium]|nr:hypothetical protein [Bryobacteraceae bacterium]